MQSVIDAFNGTVLLVSHDRYLIDALATQIWSVGGGAFDAFEGTYADYVEARNQGKTQEASSNGSNGKSRKQAAQYAEKKHGLSPYELQKRVGELEAQITELESEMAFLTREIADASAEGDTDRIESLGKDYNRTETALEASLAEWERLAE